MFSEKGGKVSETKSLWLKVPLKGATKFLLINQDFIHQ